MMLVSLQQARNHLRSDDSDDDADLSLKILAASAAVLAYLKDGATFVDSNGDVPVDSYGDPVGVPRQVQAATLLMVGYLYRLRDENEDEAYEHGYLPKPVTSLLYPLRDPAIA